jgi:plastocyanin
MRIRASLGYASILVLFALAGCGGEAKVELAYPPRAVKDFDPALPKIAVGGRVSYSGPVPERRRLPNADAWCSSAGRVLLDEQMIVGKDGGLANVFVHVKDGLYAVEGPDRKQVPYVFDYEKTPAEMDQKACVFIPHVLGVQCYQPVKFLNDDPVAHNVNTLSSRQGQGFNLSMTGQGRTDVRQLKKPELALKVTCDVHSNMLAYVHVVDHPFFGVTDTEGKWSFARPLPTGRYVIELVHEKLGKRELVIEVDAAAPMFHTEYSWPDAK